MRTAPSETPYVVLSAVFSAGLLAAARVGHLAQDTAAVFEKTYQRGLGVGRAHAEAEPALQRLAAERGWLRAFVL